MALPTPRPEDEAVLALLPPSLAELARVSSVAAALALAREYGGRRIYIPEVMTETHPLAELIGYDAATALSHHYPGDRPEIPMLRDWRAKVKANAIASARRAGRTQAELAREYGMTERGIRLAERRAETVADVDQLDLF
ncbi:Mor transcription activator family protein [Zoogloea sp.]|uniref:Mor transcription activator family protein n=1 Tax=Zoogloea sp. TaxID=49181 RepID=UPI0035B02DE9